MSDHCTVPLPKYMQQWMLLPGRSSVSVHDVASEVRSILAVLLERTRSDIVFQQQRKTVRDMNSQWDKH